MDYDELLGLFEQGKEDTCQSCRNHFAEWRTLPDGRRVKAIYGAGGGEVSDLPDSLQVVGTDEVHYVEESRQFS